MSTVITAGNATNGLSLTPDNTGAFEFKTGTGAGTTALTLSSSQVATFAAGVSGTTGSFSGNMSFNSGYGSAAVAYGCRAWVNFNGSGTPAIRASGNVTSITDNGTGDYTVNFTTAMPDINFDVNGTCSTVTGANTPVVYDNSPARARTTSTVSVRTIDAANFGDPVWVNITVMR